MTPDEEAVLEVLRASSRGLTPASIATKLGWYRLDLMDPNDHPASDVGGSRRGPNKHRAISAATKLVKKGLASSKTSAKGTKWNAKEKR
jgi:hypothetical protein